MTKYINISLGYLNWIIIPVKVLLFIVVSVITRAIEPYKKPKAIPVYDDRILSDKKEVFEEQLKKFEYEGYILSSYRGQVPDGRNHDYGDWCFMNGLRLASLCYKYGITGTREDYNAIKSAALQYVTDWIDDKGYMARGWAWYDGFRGYVYNISGDAITSFVYAMSLVPMEILKESCRYKIVQFAERLIADGFIVDDPQGGRDYWRDYRLGLLSYGQSPITAMALMMLVYRLTGEDKYKRIHDRYIRHGAGFLVMFPIGKLFEVVNDFAFNITMMSLAAYSQYNLQLASRGLRWIAWINERVYNPFWCFLKYLHGMTGPERVEDIARVGDDYEICLYLLSTCDTNNMMEYETNSCLTTDKFSDKDNIEIKKYFRLFGKKYTTLPPSYGEKTGDQFIFQRIERQIDKFGLESREGDWNYNPIFYLITYWLYRNIEIRTADGRGQGA